jgi:pullulanase/glycogen debranching enzyme
MQSSSEQANRNCHSVPFWQIRLQRSVDLSHRTALHFTFTGHQRNADGLYLMINAYWQPLTFTIQEGSAREWRRIADTSLPSLDDFSDRGVPIDRMSYQVFKIDWRLRCRTLEVRSAMYACTFFCSYPDHCLVTRTTDIPSFFRRN